MFKFFRDLKLRWSNFILCIKYPIIIPRTMMRDKMCTNFFSYTWLDRFPEGWRKAFGINFFKDLQEVLNKYPRNSRKSFRIYDIKEKYGTLRIHANWYTDDISQVIDKYEKLSIKTCINCGNKAYWLSKGWIMPLCNHCKKELKHKYKFNPIYKKHKRRNKNGK